MIRAAFASIVLALFAPTVHADAAADLQAAQQLALKFIAIIDRGEIDEALAMYDPPQTQAGQALKMVAGANLPAEATRELTKQHEQQLAQALAARRAYVERNVAARKSRGALKNTRLQGSMPIPSGAGYNVMVESDASVSVQLAGGEARTTQANILVTRSEPSAPFRIQSFQTNY